MPKVFYTDKIVKTLGKFPNLQNLAIGEPSEMYFNRHPLMKQYSYHVGEVKEDFRMLDTLAFTGSQYALCDGFLDRQRFSSLTEIYWNQCIEIYDPESFFTSIVEACPKLHLLFVGQPDAYADKDDLPSVIPWEFIRIILRPQYFLSLSLYCCRVSMDSEDWIELLTGCEMWRDIYVYSVTPLPLSDLIIFAKYCPFLTTLGIYVDVPSVDDINPNDIPLPSSISPIESDVLTPGPDGPSHTFCNLKEMNVYHSNLGPKIASFILGLCRASNVGGPPSVSGWDWPEEFESFMHGIDDFFGDVW